MFFIRYDFFGCKDTKKFWIVQVLEQKFQQAIAYLSIVSRKDMFNAHGQTDLPADW